MKLKRARWGERNGLSVLLILMVYGGNASWSQTSASSLPQQSNESISSGAFKPIVPTIDGILPNPVPAHDGPQVFVINGTDFERGCNVVLRDKVTQEEFSLFKFGVLHPGQLVITPNFIRAEHHWTVEIVNPGDYRSGEFGFDVVSEERISARAWWHSGWPWLWLSLAGLGGAALLLWLQRKQWAGKVALARAEGRRAEHVRISRDLHDSVNDLNQVNLLAGKLKILTDSPQATSAGGEIAKTARLVSTAVVEAINAIEDITWAGHEHTETLGNLAAHLHEKVGEFRKLNPNLNCVLDMPHDLPEREVPPGVGAHLLRIASEALRNALMHAAATELRCELALRDSYVRLSLRDNGRGFQPDKVHGSGRGLRNLRRRAEELGGSFEIQSAPGSGTAVIVSIPLENELTRCGG